MKTEDISKKQPTFTEEAKKSSPSRTPLQLVKDFFKPKKAPEELPSLKKGVVNHKIVHTPRVNHSGLSTHLTQLAIDLFYMKVISILEKKTKLTPLQARATLTHAQISCALTGDLLQTTCHIEDHLTITFLFEKGPTCKLFSRLKAYSIKS